MPKPYIVKSVLDAVRSIPEHSRFKVLDLSCGQGEILSGLHQAVSSAEGTHYRPDDYIVKAPLPILKQLKIHENISLDQALPFEAETYDMVIMTEVIEHLMNHMSALSEVARIIKPNGYLIITTPNTARLHSRASFFLTGAHKLIRRRVGWDTDRARFHEYHINPLDFPTCHAMLHSLGFKIQAIRCTHVKKRHLYLLLLYPLIWLASLREYGIPHGPAAFRAGEHDLFRKMTGFPLLCSEQLLIVAKKITP